MSYTNLLDLYDFIYKRLEDVHQALVAAGDEDGKTKQHAAGRIEALCEMERFLREYYDAKLPRRIIRQRLHVKGCGRYQGMPKN